LLNIYRNVLPRQLLFNGIDANEFDTRICDEKSILFYIFMINKIKSKITMSFYGQHIFLISYFNIDCSVGWQNLGIYIYIYIYVYPLTYHMYSLSTYFIYTLKIHNAKSICTIVIILRTLMSIFLFLHYRDCIWSFQLCNSYFWKFCQGLQRITKS